MHGHNGPPIGSRPLGVKWSHDRWRHRPRLEIFSPQFLKSGNILRTLERQFSITTSMPVTISMIFNGFQIDARSLIQAERNGEKQKKMMCARSTPQCNNISCFYLTFKPSCTYITCDVSVVGELQELFSPVIFVLGLKWLIFNSIICCLFIHTCIISELCSMQHCPNCIYFSISLVPHCFCAV